MDTSKIDLLSLVGVSLKKIAQTNGGEWHGPCPFCGGNDRFWVTPSKGRWYCRHCNEKGGDAIAFIQKRDNCDFKTALATLGLEADKGYTRPKSPPPAPRVKDTDREKPALSEEWQAEADKFIMQCFRNLRGNPFPLEYLYSRGITDAQIILSRLGYNPSGYENHWGGVKVYLPQGIVIPWELSYQITAIRVRKQGVKAGEQKYAQAAGMVQSLYYPVPWEKHPYEQGDIAVLVEGEFDAMVLHRAARYAGYLNVKPCAVGSTTNGRTMANVLALAQADRVLIAFDGDDAGQGGSKWWLDKLDNAALLKLPAHDPTDMQAQKGFGWMVDWLKGVIRG